jgi:hypothetical protein
VSGVFFFLSFALVEGFLGVGRFDTETWMVDDWINGRMRGALVLFLFPELWELLIRS